MGNREVRETLENAPTLPDALTYLWEWYEELKYARQSNGMGVVLLTPADIRAWRKETGRPKFRPYEWEVIKGWDVLYAKSKNDTLDTSGDSDK